MRRPHLFFDDASAAVDRFGWLLAMTVATVVLLSLVPIGADGGLEDDLLELLLTVLVGATLLLALRASGVSRRYRRVAEVVVGLGMAASALLVVAHAFDVMAMPSSGVGTILWLVLSVLAPAVVTRRLFQHRRADARTLAGAVSAYLLIAIAFNFAFLFVNANEPLGFFGAREPSTSFMYFSLTSLTTLGYGDLTAATPPGRLLSTLEAIIGQVYLVTFVAMIVGLMVAQRGGRLASEDDA